MKLKNIIRAIDDNTKLIVLMLFYTSLCAFSVSNLQASNIEEIIINASCFYIGWKTGGQLK